MPPHPSTPPQNAELIMNVIEKHSQKKKSTRRTSAVDFMKRMSITGRRGSQT